MPPYLSDHAAARVRPLPQRLLVVSGVLRGPGDVRRYGSAFGAPLRCVLLTARTETAEARLRGRCSDAQSAALEWHLQRHQAFVRELEAAGCIESVIATDDRSPSEIARSVLRSVA